MHIWCFVASLQQSICSVLQKKQNKKKLADMQMCAEPGSEFGPEWTPTYVHKWKISHPHKNENTYIKRSQSSTFPYPNTKSTWCPVESIMRTAQIINRWFGVDVTCNDSRQHPLLNLKEYFQQRDRIWSKSSPAVCYNWKRAPLQTLRHEGMILWTLSGVHVWKQSVWFRSNKFRTCSMHFGSKHTPV